MPEPLEDALTRVRTLLLAPDRLVRAVAAGRRRGATPTLVRAELRPVVLKTGRQLQVTTTDGSRPLVRNVAPGTTLETTVDTLLAEPFGNWYVQTVDETVQLRVTKRGEARVHVSAPVAAPPVLAHDRPNDHLLAPDDPLFDVIGASAAKRRQVDAFLRALAATMATASSSSGTADPDGTARSGGVVRVVDLGCGNAYLTFAAYRYLRELGLGVRVTGVDVRDDQRARNAALADRLGWTRDVTFVAGTIKDAAIAGADLVLALHACDTATDEALARAVHWRARWVLAAPCCHHDIAAQLRRHGAPEPYAPLVRHAIVRERFADVLTDALRAALLRSHGYRVDVVEFIDSVHTARNLLIRATYSGTGPTPSQSREYAELTAAWQVTPRLATLLADT